MKNSAPTKQEYVQRELARAVQRGDFRGRERLPGVRELAATFGVSYMTALRAVRGLVADGLIESRARSGMFLRTPPERADAENMTLNIICSAYKSADMDRFLSLATSMTASRGWKHTLIRVTPGYERDAVDALLSDSLSLVFMHEYFGWSSVKQALVSASDRSVVVGDRLDDLGVMSVMGHDSLAMQLAVDYLLGAGHRRIGLVMHHPHLRQARLRLASWRAAQQDTAPHAELLSRQVIVDIPEYGSQTESAYRRVKKYLQEGRLDATALVCINDELATGTMAACRDAGLAIPDDVSIFSMTNTELGRFTQPALTCFEINKTEEIRAAFSLLEQRLNDALPEWDCLCLVPPRLIERHSVHHKSGADDLRSPSSTADA